MTITETHCRARATKLAEQCADEEGHKAEVEDSEAEELAEKIDFDGDLEQADC